VNSGLEGAVSPYLNSSPFEEILNPGLKNGESLKWKKLKNDIGNLEIGEM